MMTEVQNSADLSTLFKNNKAQKPTKNVVFDDVY